MSSSFADRLKTRTRPRSVRHRKIVSTLVTLGWCVLIMKPWLHDHGNGDSFWTIFAKISAVMLCTEGG